MPLTRQDMARLTEAAKSFHTVGRTGKPAGSHVSFLAEAAGACRAAMAAGHEDPPLEALKLLAGLKHSGFASRPNEKVSLNDVGGWLQRRVGSSDVTGAELLLELGWLKRLVKFTPGLPLPGRGSQPVEFGTPSDLQRVENERIRRRKRAERELRAEEEAQAQVERPPLPDAFEACFAEPLTVGAQRKLISRDRKKAEKKKAEPKERLLKVASVAGDHELPASGLVASSTRTEGLDAVLSRGVEKLNGRFTPDVLTFRVVSWSARGDDEPALVERVELVD